MTKQDVLDQCNIVGNVVFLPDTQLDRKLYTEVQKALKGIGGKWNRGSKGFLFTEDPSELMGRVKKGEKVNLKKEFQEFFTPEALADRVIELADIGPNDDVLEPSAGEGALIDAIIRDNNAICIVAVEIQERNTIKLTEKYKKEDVAIYNDDFLSFVTNVNGGYNKIVANPPFTKNQDIKHIKNMYDILSSNGTLVCIMSKGWMTTQTSICKGFREWLGFTESLYQGYANIYVSGLEPRDVYIEDVDAGEFKESGTQVATCIVKIQKLY